MIQKKKYAKAAKIIPDGYESANLLTPVRLNHYT